MPIPDQNIQSKVSIRKANISTIQINLLRISQIKIYKMVQSRYQHKKKINKCKIEK